MIKLSHLIWICEKILLSNYLIARSKIKRIHSSNEPKCLNFFAQLTGDLSTIQMMKIKANSRSKLVFIDPDHRASVR